MTRSFQTVCDSCEGAPFSDTASYCPWCGAPQEDDDAPLHVVYTLDEDCHPAHFLGLARGYDDLQDTVEKWWKAFESGSKRAPSNYEGISHRPLSSFDLWPAGDGGDDA